jgi:hypothetical protein
MDDPNVDAKGYGLVLHLKLLESLGKQKNFWTDNKDHLRRNLHQLFSW